MNSDIYMQRLGLDNMYFETDQRVSLRIVEPTGMEPAELIRWYDEEIPERERRKHVSRIKQLYRKMYGMQE